MKLKLYFILLFFANTAFAQYQGPIPAITSGYGSYGPNAVSVTNIPNDHFLLKDISVFYPSGTTTPIPAIFFSHGYGANDTSYYIETIKNIASNGYAVVFVPYKTIGASISERYLTLFDGFIKAAENLSSVIDTTKVGFYGHSFGGGATPSISYRFFKERNWGANGKFIYCSAPWYSYELGSEGLDNFPPDCNMLTVLFDNDSVNDHRMGMDVFNNIAINESIKDCISVYSDTVSDYVYDANHNLPAQYTTKGTFDAYDYYVTFRLLGALADYTFTGNPSAKNIALGNGSAAQIDMGGTLKPLSVTDSPYPIYSESKYQYPCDTIINERNAYCLSVLGVNDEMLENNNAELYPNPTDGKFYIITQIAYQQLSISIFSMTGEKLLSGYNQNEMDISDFNSGIYFVLINIDGMIEIKKIIKVE